MKHDYNCDVCKDKGKLKIGPSNWIVCSCQPHHPPISEDKWI